MIKKFRFSSILALMLVLVLALTACNFGNSTQSGPAGGNNKTLVMTDTAEPPSLDVSKSTDVVSSRVLNNVMEGLMSFDKEQKPQPAIASAPPKVSADKLTYTFNLRDSKWSDGKPVRAQDFEYSWLRNLDPKTKSEYAFIMFPIKNAEEYNAGKAKKEDVGIKALNDKTLEVTLKSPIPYFTGLAAFGTYQPQRQDIVEKHGDKYSKEANTNVYNGPFVLSEWKHDASLTMTKNPQYWDKDKVKLDKIEVKIIKEIASGLNLYNTNKVDFTLLSQEFADTFKDKPDRTVLKELSSWYMEVNHQQKFFQNKKIREALNYAIDKKTLVDGIMKNGSQPSGALVPPSINATLDTKFRDVSPSTPKYDPAKAKQLYQEGLKELGMTKQPKTFELVGDDTDTAKKSMEYIKEQLRTNMGFEIKVAAVPFKQRLDRGKNQQFDLLMGGWNGDYNDPQTFTELFLKDSTYNRGKWVNAEYDEIVKKSATNPNIQERLNDQVKAEKILVDDTAIVPLYYRSQLGATKTFVKGLYWNLVGQTYTAKEAYIDWKE